MTGAMYNRKQLSQGFTLVELIVAAALFATVIAVSVNLFILTLRKPLIEVDNQHLQEEVSYLFELLANKMTTATIDYDSYGGTLTNPVTDLYLNEEGVIMRYYLSGGQIMQEDVAATTSTPVTTTSNNDVLIDSVRFYGYPTSDPTDPATSINYQPTVLVAITGHSVKDSTRTFKVQTLLTTRGYVR